MFLPAISIRRAILSAVPYIQRAAPVSTQSLSSRPPVHSGHSTKPPTLLYYPSPCISLLHNRHFTSNTRGSHRTSNTSTVRYIVATTIAVLGLSYAAVPLYRLFCQASGYGGTVTKVEAGEKVEKMEPVRERDIVVR